MLKRMLASALIAGAAAGLIAALLQFIFVQPVLLHAELYEGGELVHFEGVIATPEDHGDEAVEDGDAIVDEHEHDHGAEAEGIDWHRDGLSVVFTVLVYSGYGLLLVSAFAIAGMLGHRVTARQGLIWGIAGYIALQLAPAAGLAPELPGMSAADVYLRQAWWIATVVLTALGLWLIAFGRNWGAWGLAIVLIALPHVIGAPQPEAFFGPTPPELAGEFAGRVLAVGLVAWALLGLFAATLWQKSQEA